MSEGGLGLSIATNAARLKSVLAYGRSHLSTERYNQVQTAFNKMMKHSVIRTLIWVLGGAGVGTFLTFMVLPMDAVGWGLFATIAVPTIIIAVDELYYRKHTRSGRIWFMLRRWSETGDEKFRYELEKLLDESSK